MSKKDHRCDVLHWIVSLGAIGFSFMFTFVPPSTGPFAGPDKEGQARSVNGCILWCEATETVCDFPFLNFFFLYLNGLTRRLISTYQDTCFIYEKHEILFRLEFILPKCMNRTFAKSRWRARVQYSTKGFFRHFSSVSSRPTDYTESVWRKLKVHGSLSWVDLIIPFSFRELLVVRNSWHHDMM